MGRAADPAPRLSQRALNRATLDRQLLPRRNPLPAWQAVRHLADGQLYKAEIPETNTPC